ncbi:MAG: hypothetical protein AABZ60_16095, partial [Planctomycetota bacterium]
MERQNYYRQFVRNQIETYFSERIDLTKAAESILPEVQIDLFFEIPKEKLTYASESPFPYLKEANLVHIKAVNDHLTPLDVLQYLGELYVKASTNDLVKKQSIALTIVSAEEVPESVFKESYHPRERTEIPWIDQIKASYPAYLFTMERLPAEEKYYEFLPFMPLKAI